VPKIEDENDLSNIDKMFTREHPTETPENNLLLQKQKFDDFTYVERKSGFK
jgi:Protein kinase C terminal domain